MRKVKVQWRWGWLAQLYLVITMPVLDHTDVFEYNWHQYIKHLLPSFKHVCIYTWMPSERILLDKKRQITRITYEIFRRQNLYFHACSVFLLFSSFIDNSWKFKSLYWYSHIVCICICTHNKTHLIKAYSMEENEETSSYKQNVISVTRRSRSAVSEWVTEWLTDWL